jgi:uncharacterized protein
LDVTAHLEPYRQGGQLYTAKREHVPLIVDVDAMDSGYAIRLRFSTDLHGPCSRCLEDAGLHLDIDTREVHDERAELPDLRSEFVENDVLDIRDWAQDALGLEFPVRVLCKEDCKGLCPNCGTNWNQATCDCAQEQGDSRWDKLRDVRFEDEGTVG